MRRYVAPFVALLALIVGLNRYVPGGLSRLVVVARTETQDEELNRLESECDRLRGGIERDTKALYRVQTNYALARRKKLRGAALERIRLPMYQLRERIELSKEQLAESESRVAFLKDDQRQLLESHEPEEPPADGGPEKKGFQ